MIIFWIIVAIIMFSIIILIHEWWHFKASRIFWVKVEEFWLWIPPRAKKIFTDKKWTLYSINWLPIWGFVKLKWENPEVKGNKDDKESLINKPVWQQSIILLAWVFMNFVLAIFIFSILFFIWVKPVWVNTQIETDLNIKLIPQLSEAIDSWFLIKWDWVLLFPLENSIANKAWIEKNDNIISVTIKNNIIKINNTKDIIDIIWNNKDKNIILNIIRNNENINIDIIPSSEGKIWSYISENLKINKNFVYKYWFFESIKYWILETYSQTLLTFKWLKLLLIDIFTPETPKQREEAIDKLSWPIWIVDFISNSIWEWLIFILIIWAIISINLAIFNLLPIPIFDWWRFIILLIDTLLIKIFSKKIIKTYHWQIVHIIFFFLIIALMILIWYNDIIKIINR